VVATGLVTGLVAWPLAKPAQAVNDAPEVHRDMIPVARETLQMGDFAAVLDKRLQQPLEDPPPPQPTPPPTQEVVAARRPQVALPELRLLGTAKDSDQRHSVAWLQSPGKPAILVALGETLKTIPGQPTVEKIDAGSATLKFGEREVVLKVKVGPNVK
jgi:hypothetical protein